ncbi:MAG TPA: sigma-70 family RNA polymerase sigma factor [Acidimicrobiales bacterium]|nr:sigma-70 family RNA polymerase sigma factor [Acidimicrobiales bacterium]
MTPTEVVGPATGAWPEPLLACYRTDRLELVRVAYLITGNRHVAEEIVQDAFVASARAWPRVRDTKAYVRAAVVNGSRSWLRRRRLERSHAYDRAEASVASPDELSDVLGRLNPRQRAAVVLRYYEGLPDAEIARVLGCRIATVRTVIHRALGALRHEIQR